MHSAREGNQATRQRGNQAAMLLLAMAVALTAAYARAESAGQPDAVIELWEQHWTLNADGSTVYHEKQNVQLNNDRAYGEYSDPRITYNVDTDELKIITARVKLANGTYLELPDYAHVFVSPGATSGWPAFANIRQHLLVMSGIEPGCVVELEYQITSKPGTRSYLAGDVRMDDRYPITKRLVEVTAPRGKLRFDARCPSGMLETNPRVTENGDVATLRWELANVPPVLDEHNAPSWEACCGRLLFSTAGSPETWLKDTLGRIDAGAVESKLMTDLATEWTKDRSDAGDKLRAIQEKLAASFNFISFDVAWRPDKPRNATETLQSNYGLPDEAAGVLLALGRAAAIPLRLGVLVDDDSWTDGAPQAALVSSYVVLFDRDGETEIWDPHYGRIMRNSRWAWHTLLTLTKDKFERRRLGGWESPDESVCRLSGTVIVDKGGSWSGTVSLRTTGLFVSPESLRSTDSQKSRVSSLVAHLLPDAKIESFTVKTLSDREFEVAAQVKSSKPLTKLDGRYCLQFAEDSPFMANISLPLGPRERVNPVRIAGPFDEQVDLVVEWPKGWRVEAQPIDLAKQSGAWGELEQGVTVGTDRLTLTRHTRVTQRDLPAKNFLVLREPLNELRTDAARTLLLAP